jgi:hypothetical protein
LEFEQHLLPLIKDYLSKKLRLSDRPQQLHDIELRYEFALALVIQIMLFLLSPPEAEALEEGLKDVFEGVDEPFSIDQVHQNSLHIS